MGGLSGGFLAVVPVVDLPRNDGGASDAGIVSEGGLHDPKWSGRGRERLFPDKCGDQVDVRCTESLDDASPRTTSSGFRRFETLAIPIAR